MEEDPSRLALPRRNTHSSVFDCCRGFNGFWKLIFAHRLYHGVTLLGFLVLAFSSESNIREVFPHFQRPARTESSLHECRRCSYFCVISPPAFTFPLSLSFCFFFLFFPDAFLLILIDTTVFFFFGAASRANFLETPPSLPA